MMPSDAVPAPETTPRPGPSARSRTRGLGVRLARWLFKVVATVATVLIITRITGCAERMFYWPQRGHFDPPGRAEEVWFEGSVPRLHGWFIPALRGPRDADELAPTIVYCHGNAGNISNHLPFVEFLPPAGFNVLIFDYRGYGQSDNASIRREPLVQDAIAAVRYVLSREDVDPDRVGLYGLSLGGTIGLAAAAESPGVRCVVSVATFSSWPGVANDYFPVLGRWLIPPGRDAVDSAAALGERPLLIVHSRDDEIVGYRHAPLIEASALRAGVDARLSTFDTAGHVDWIETEPAMVEAIIAFFTEHLVDGSPATRPPSSGPPADRP